MLKSAPGETRFVICAILLLAAMMTLKFYPGLENEPVYAGVAYQTIHPDAFAGDPYRSPDLEMGSRIIQLSLMYGLVKAIGDIWLDDRFLMVVYLGLVLIGLVGVDRTARLLGAQGPFERLIILMVFAKDHAILDHKVLLAHHQDVNHTAFAIPIIIWMFYAALARKGLPIVLALAILLLATSIRNAPIPIVMAMAVVFFTGAKRDRWIVGVLSVCGVLASYWVLTDVMAVSEADRIALWNILKDAAGGDVNPFYLAFHEPVRFLVQNSIWMAIVGAAFFAAPRRDPAFNGIRVIMCAAVLTWLIGGLYISFAPDALKFALLQGIAPTRALAWPQNLAYIALFALAFRAIDRPGPDGNKAVWVAALAVLFVLGPGNTLIWAAMLLVAACAVVIARAAHGKVTSSAVSSIHNVVAQPRPVIAQILALTLAVSYGVAIYKNAPAWATAFRTGVYGNAAPAYWINVAEYVRDHTPKDSVVLPIAKDKNTGTPKIDRSFGTRSGRAMPVPEDFPGDFRSPDAWQEADRQERIIERVSAAITDADFCKMARAVAELAPRPGYIVIARDLLGQENAQIGKYKQQSIVDGHVVLAYDHAASGPCP